jgi:peptidoglycan/LPS O-acetylase OafA/YrhL
VSDRTTKPAVYDWQTAIGFALVATGAAVALIVLFTYLVDWVGDFWSQVIYFVVVFGGIVALAVRSRRKDEADPSRLGRTPPITLTGLPGPFVVTQALGVLAIAMLIVAIVVGGDRGLIWGFSALVLGLVGLVGLVFWLAGLRGQRRA